jgi:hypothetical protein
MDRDKVFVDVMRGLLSNPRLVHDQYALNMDSRRKQLIEMAKLMTNLIMKEIENDEQENNDLDL